MERNTDTTAARRYHQSTNHSEVSLRSGSHYLDFPNRPIPFKIYTTLDPLRLPTEFTGTDVPVLDAIAPPDALSPPAADVECIPDLATLARVFFLGAGVLHRKTYPNGMEMFFRSYANTGALYHIDLYLVCADLPDLPAGVYHFSPHDFALRRLRAGDYRRVLADASGHDSAVVRAPAILVSASTYWRNSWKYQARAYRHCGWDAGTMHANVLAAAETAGLRPHVVVGFADAPVEHLLGLNPQTEGALTLVSLGRSPTPPPEAPAAAALHLDTMPLSPNPLDYPAIREIHAASSLETGEEAAAWHGGLPEIASPPATGRLVPLALPGEADMPKESLDGVIMRRGSTRDFDPDAAITFAQLSAALDRATRPVSADFLTPGAPSLQDLYVIAHNVTGLAPGAYYFRRGESALELLREGEFRRHAGRLGLFQELPACAAVNIYSLTNLTAVLERFGNRGYRAAQLEGGIVGGRLYLAAYGQRFGATGLTFLDDEVIDFFSPHAAGKSVMFLTALGHTIRRRRSVTSA